MMRDVTPGSYSPPPILRFSSTSTLPLRDVINGWPLSRKFYLFIVGMSGFHESPTFENTQRDWAPKKKTVVRHYKQPKTGNISQSTKEGRKQYFRCSMSGVCLSTLDTFARCFTLPQRVKSYEKANEGRKTEKLKRYTV